MEIEQSMVSNQNKKPIGSWNQSILFANHTINGENSCMKMNWKITDPSITTLLMRFHGDDNYKKIAFLRHLKMP